MLTNSEIEWLADAHPRLIPNKAGSEVKGYLEFVAVYEKDKAKDGFTLLRPGDIPPTGGVTFSGSYRVHIVTSKREGRLPSLRVDDKSLPTDQLQLMNRHFYPRDKSACVCGVVEESRLVAQGLNFKVYIEELAIPFLYGQKYFEKHGVWPWKDYAHGTCGALESYFAEGSPEFVASTIQRLTGIPKDMAKVKAILTSKERPKGHLPCFCDKHDHIRRCHPDAWGGLLKLYNHLRSSEARASFDSLV